MKIFHRSPSETESAKLLDTEGVEEVSLPEETIREIARVLKKSGEELPPNGRVFREWEVGMLERFEG
ncbi:hypothetical protein OIDMADRAFT_19858 [Oidiodendron maius Zn]|uniref:Uncharacterized protein n=1 Tax=Oidiodendron maius (strain Zn) TaxID=913774 RepID=A0A0C3H678_OIDMZ|nr:hypothetical protein OIDMADRAFT_19858 [Oidiodendron maius Zn]